MKKSKLFILPFLAMSIGALSSCTKDDISALQEKDDDLQSQIDSLKDEVAGLKNQITDLQTEMGTKINEAKADYNAQINALKDEVAEDKAALATFKTDYASDKAALKTELEAEIKAVDDKYAPLVKALQDDVVDLKAEDTRLAGLIADLEDALGDDTSDLETKINNVNTALEALKTALKDYDVSDPSVKGVADKVAAVDAKVDALSSQAAADKAELSADYTAKLNALDTAYKAADAALSQRIENNLDSIGDLEEELANQVTALRNDYTAKINALTERVAALEEVVTHTVTFDVQGGTEMTPVVVIHGDKVAQPDDPVKGGFVFQGWKYEDTNNDWLFFGYTVTEDLTLTAQWQLDESLPHDYSSNEEVLLAPSLQQDGITRLHCGEEGHVDYKDITTYIPYFYVSSSISNYSYGTIISGTLEQGTLYDGDEICVQLNDGTLTHLTIEELHDISDNAVDSIGAGEFFIIALGDQIAHTDISVGSLVCPAGEEYVTNWINGSLYLLTKAEGGRHTPIFPNYRPKATIGNTTVTGTVNLPEGMEMMMPGQTADITYVLPSPLFVKNGTVLELMEGSKVIGYLTVNSSIETISISGNGCTFDADTEYAPLYNGTNSVAFTQSGEGFTLPEQSDFLESSIPLFRELKGFAYDKNATNPDYAPGEEIDLEGSYTLYAIWGVAPNMIFDFTGTETFNSGLISGKGMSVRANFVNAGNTAIAKGDTVTVYYGTTDNYETIETYIDYIDNYDGDDTEYYIGNSDEQEITIYLRNIGDDVMNTCLGIELNTVHDNVVSDAFQITGRGTLIEVTLPQDVATGNTIKILLNDSAGTVQNSLITGIYRNRITVVENASAGETVFLLLRGINLVDISVGTMYWLS